MLTRGWRGSEGLREPQIASEGLQRALEGFRGPQGFQGSSEGIRKSLWASGSLRRLMKGFGEAGKVLEDLRDLRGLRRPHRARRTDRWMDVLQDITAFGVAALHGFTKKNKITVGQRYH